MLPLDWPNLKCRAIFHLPGNFSSAVTLKTIHVSQPCTVPIITGPLRPFFNLILCLIDKRFHFLVLKKGEKGWGTF